MSMSLTVEHTDEDLDELDRQGARTITAWATHTANQKPPLKSFAKSSRRNALLRPGARKALQMGATPVRSNTEESLTFFTEPIDAKQRTTDSTDENILNFASSSYSPHSRTSSSAPFHAFLMAPLQQRSPEAPPLVERRSRADAKKNIVAGGSNAFPPHLPPMHRCTRSWSIALGTLATPASRENYSNMLHALHNNASHLDGDEGCLPWLSEQSHFNLSESLLETPENIGERKKRARRASIQGCVPSLSDFTYSARRHTTFSLEPLPMPQPSTPIRALTASASTPTQTRSELGSPSTSSRTSSSRKRGVCGSPISDFMDDISTGGLSASLNSTCSLSVRRSRSRIFSPVSNILPLPPSLNPPLLLEPAKKTKKPISKDECRGMKELHSDDDDDDLSQSSAAPHVTMTNAADDSQTFPVIAISSRGTNFLEKHEGTELVENTSNFGDREFLIEALRKEACGRTAAFGGAPSWTVAPPKSWDSTRRSAFFKWTVTRFKFAVRPLGNSVNVLQISRTNGQSVLAKLEEELASNKELSAGNVVPPVQTVVHNGSHAFFKEGRSPAVSAPCTALFYDPATIDLTSGFRTLTVNETEPVPGKSDMSFDIPPDFLQVVETSRMSLEPSVGGTTRPSFESSVSAATDIMLHLHGHDSPEKFTNEEENPTRQQKMSLSSVASTYSRGRPSAPTPIVLEVMETPQIKQDEGWGSRPVPGKDWGISSPCNKDVLSVLSERFEDAGRNAGARDSLESCGGLPVMPCGLEMDDFSEIPNEDDVAMHEEQDGRRLRRRQLSFAKHIRMSLWAAASQDDIPLLPAQKSGFHSNRRTTIVPVEEVSKSLHEYGDSFPIRESSFSEDGSKPSVTKQVLEDEGILATIFTFLTEGELVCKISLVSMAWAEVASTAHAAVMIASLGYLDEPSANSIAVDDHSDESYSQERRSHFMDRDWGYLTNLFPWACFLSSGTFKKVFKVYNSAVGHEEALSVMDVEAIVDKKTIASELMVTARLSSMSRRGICPNFVVMHGVFTLPYDVPKSHWGCPENKEPKGSTFQDNKKLKRPPQPKKAFPGRYQFIRMELCHEGDFEEFIKHQEQECLRREISRISLFQIAFALHAAAERHSLKHYDVKLLNVFVKGIKVNTADVVLRYGLGSHVFALCIPSKHAFYAKLADYGTANIKAESTGQPVTIAQFTTLENTPPDYMILGDGATQGHGHDNFGLGLSMLHLFTGHAPYEEILEDVVCPPMLKKRLRMIWEDENVPEYSVIRSVILCDVYKDERGHILEGEPDKTLYDTLYRFLVLFGIPEDKFAQREYPLVWKAISESLEAKALKGGGRQTQGSDIKRFERDCQKYSIRCGNNPYISRARKSLEEMEGGMELLFQLCSFNPKKRATSLQVLNSTFMRTLREEPMAEYGGETSVFSFTSFLTHREKQKD